MLEKYLELSQIYQSLAAEHKLLQDALVKLTDDLEKSEFSHREKDLTIADLVVERNRLRDMLKLQTKDLEDLKKGYRIPEDEQVSLFDKIFRGVK